MINVIHQAMCDGIFMLSGGNWAYTPGLAEGYITTAPDLFMGMHALLNYIWCLL